MWAPHRAARLKSHIQAMLEKMGDAEFEEMDGLRTFSPAEADHLKEQPLEELRLVKEQIQEEKKGHQFKQVQKFDIEKFNLQVV